MICSKRFLRAGVLIFLGFLFLTACARWNFERDRGERLWSSDQGFPEREIVFEIVGRDGFGFIRPDGSGLITREVAPGLNPILPTWSPDGQFLAFRASISGTGGSYFEFLHPRVLSAEGETVGWCFDWGAGAGRIWVTLEGQLVFPMRGGDEPNRVVLADFNSCKILSTLFTAVGTESSERLDSATLSNQGWLAVSRIFVKNGARATTDIVVIDPNSQEERVVGHGLAPAWSADGEWLAFTEMDGIYVVRKDGSQKRKVVDVDARAESYPNTSGLDWYHGLPTPSWSPDGEWLVYHRMTSSGRPVIYKANVASGIEVEIFQGGTYPDWRWDLDVEGR
jgi:hypothetical protein